MDVVSLACKLIDIDSTSGKEGEVGRFLSEYLKHLGYETEMQIVEPDRFNILATACERPRLFFSTHLDTVPPHIASRSTVSHIYGRGACDAKGIIACQIAAAERIRKRRPAPGLLFTVDEEVASLGATVANRHALASSCKFVINGEPTDNLLAIGSKGSLRVRLTCTGKSAHSAYPERGVSAIEKLIDVLNEIRVSSWPEDDTLGNTTVNIGIIEGGTKSNVIAEKGTAELHFRLVTSANQVRQQLESLVGGRAMIDVLSSSEPVRLRRLEGFETTVARFSTDISYLSNWGTAFLLGPGSILDAHTMDERVSIAELQRAVGLYCRMGELLLEENR